MKLSVVLTSILAASAAGAGVARAQDAGAPAADVPAGGDAGAAPAPAPSPAVVPEPAPAPAGGGGGLFEQSLSPGPGGGASDAAASTGAAAPAAVPPFTLSGYVRGDVFVGKVPDFATGTIKAATAELSLALRTAKGAHGDGFAEARVRQGFENEARQTVLDLREAYVNAYAGPFDLRLGRQIIVWGRADVLNPTNNLTPFDLRVRSPIEDDRRLGNVGARAFVKLAPFRIEGVWMPLYAPSELPAVGLPQFVTYGDPRFPAPELQNGLGAVRVHFEPSAFELSVSYLHGYAPLPGLTLSGLTFDPNTPEVRVSRTAYPQHVVGFDFSTAIGDLFALRAEAAYRRPTGYQGRSYAARPDAQYAVGADRAFGSLNVVAQYLGRYAFDWRREPGAGLPINPAQLMAMPTDFIERTVTMGINLELARTNQILFSQTARVQHLATARVEWMGAHDTLSLSALALVNFTTHEWLAAPKVGYRLSDALTAYLGAEIFSGPDGTLFGLVDQVLSAGYAELRVSF